MTRTYLSLATVFTLALAGCAKKNDQTQNPDGSTGDSGSVDGSDEVGGEDSQVPSRARRSTAPRGVDGKVKARRVTAKKPPRAPTKPDPSADSNGLIAEAFELEAAEGLPDFSELEVKQTFAVPNLDYYQVDSFPGLTALSENFALRFTGSLNIVEEAEYELCLHSDDGSQLLLEDTLVVDNDGVLDGPVEACELVYLPAGEYALEIHYFQTSGPVTMQFAWGIDGGGKGIVPSEVLFKPAR